MKLTRHYTGSVISMVLCLVLILFLEKILTTIPGNELFVIRMYLIFSLPVLCMVWFKRMPGSTKLYLLSLWGLIGIFTVLTSFQYGSMFMSRLVLYNILPLCLLFSGGVLRFDKNRERPMIDILTLAGYAVFSLLPFMLAVTGIISSPYAAIAWTSAGFWVSVIIIPLHIIFRMIGKHQISVSEK